MRYYYPPLHTMRSDLPADATVEQTREWVRARAPQRNRQSREARNFAYVMMGLLGGTIIVMFASLNRL